MKKFLNGLGRLLRLPNLFTLPGDVLCGFMMAQVYPAYSLKSNIGYGWSVHLLIFISILAYCFGLIQNDICGYEEDCAFGRENRPLVDGTISLNTAKILALLCAVFGLTCSFWVNTTAVAVFIVILLFSSLYNLFSPKFPRLSCPLMGICRGLNVLLGASAFGADVFNFEISNFSLLVCVIYHFLYITSVCLIAAKEEERGPSRFVGLLPFFGTLALVAVIPHFTFVSFAIWVFCLTISLSKKSTPQFVGQTVGILISSLILIQLCWISALTGDLFLISMILILYFGNHAVSKMFYSS